MDKISGIIPPTSRVTSVNLKDSQTMRPGAPSFGAPVGKAAINGGDLPTTAQKAVAAHHSLMSRRSGDAHHPQLIKDMTDKFFMQNRTEPGGVIDDVDLNFQMDLGPTSAPVSTAPISVPDPDMEVINYDLAPQDVQDEWLLADVAAAEQGEYVPPGSHLDVSV